MDKFLASIYDTDIYVLGDKPPAPTISTQATKEKLLVASAEELNEETKNLLTKIIGAIGISMADVRLVVGESVEADALLELNLAFGDVSIDHGSNTLITAPALSILQHDVEQKKILWEALKKITN